MGTFVRRDAGFGVVIACCVVVFSACAAQTGGASALDGGSSGGGSGSGGGGPSSGSADAGVNLSACVACAAPKCSSQSSACDSTAGCHDLLGCVLGCSQGDSACTNRCVTQASGSSSAITAAANYAECAAVQCPSVCSASGQATAADAGAAGTPHCTGTPTIQCASCASGSTCDCASTPGCQPSNRYVCSGTITSCSPIESELYCINAGCQYDGTMIPPCSGTMAKPCSQLDSDTCYSLQNVGAGCTRSTTPTCLGNPSPCTDLSVADCPTLAGCTVSTK